MSDPRPRIARAIKSFVENPVTNLVKGITLLLIGLSDVSNTLRDDAAHGRVRLGHGLALIGLFGILNALPDLLSGLKAGEQFMEYRQGRDRARAGAAGRGEVSGEGCDLE